MYEAKVLADSVSPHGVRLVTVEATMPRIVLAEFNTHRLFSRNSASSRAIPVAKQLRRVLEDPFVPEQFGSHKAGMQAGPPLEGRKLELARAQWLRARDEAVRRVLSLITSPDFADGIDVVADHLDHVADWLRQDPPEDWLAVHKQIANRLLEPFMWHTVIVTSTDWDNFFSLRDHPDAQPQIARVARLMLEAMRASRPYELREGEWHTPLVARQEPDEWLEDAEGEPVVLAAPKASAGRCARVSFDKAGETEPGGVSIARAESLTESGHMSPLEQTARPFTQDEHDAAEEVAQTIRHRPGLSGEVQRHLARQAGYLGNFRGWVQLRKLVPDEENRIGAKEGRPPWDWNAR